jgi:hypothetical protein
MNNFLLARLPGLGFHAALTSRNSAAFDILARTGASFSAIRVKSSSSRNVQWGAPNPMGRSFSTATSSAKLAAQAPISIISRTRSEDIRQARLLFERMLGYANHLRLYAEKLGPSGEHLVSCRRLPM